ncbi:MAG: hypothetical protein ACFNZZ_01570, partial [Veillonella parvula]
SWAALLCVVYLTSAAGVVGAENNSSTSVVSVDESQNNASDEQSRRMKDNYGYCYSYGGFSSGCANCDNDYFTRRN